jgi:hypothetical protein
VSAPLPCQSRLFRQDGQEVSPHCLFSLPIICTTACALSKDICIYFRALRKVFCNA